MCASPPAGDGEKLDMLINMLSKMNEKIEKLDERVKDIEMDNENENATVAIKSEYSDKEKYEVNLTSLGFLLHVKYTDAAEIMKGKQGQLKPIETKEEKGITSVNVIPQRYYKIRRGPCGLRACRGTHSLLTNTCLINTSPWEPNNNLSYKSSISQSLGGDLSPPLPFPKAPGRRVVGKLEPTL